MRVRDDFLRDFAERRWGFFFRAFGREDFFIRCCFADLAASATAFFIATIGRLWVAALPAMAPTIPPMTAPAGPATLPSAPPARAPAVCFGIGGISMFSAPFVGASFARCFRSFSISWALLIRICYFVLLARLASALLASIAYLLCRFKIDQ
jgi:hypothetical protein